MGGHPWFYFVDYEPDIYAALQKLRQREFNAGRYNPAVWFPEFPVESQAASPGAQHSSIAEALKASGESGTRSILDMVTVSATAEYSAVAPVPRADLIRLFGTDKPTHEMVRDGDELFETLERGQGVYIIVHNDEKPTSIFFAGYSFD